MVGLNPQLKLLKDMYDKGQAAIVQGVGYPNPDYSHFRSTEIWETAAPDKYTSTGWLGRYLDGANMPSENLFNAVAIADVLPWKRSSPIGGRRGRRDRAAQRLRPRQRPQQDARPWR